MTPSQIKTITKIQRAAISKWSKVLGYEFKSFALRECGNFISVVVEVGKIGDEGTLGAVLCRKRGQFFVYKGGRIVSAEKLKKDQDPLIYGWRY